MEASAVPAGSSPLATLLRSPITLVWFFLVAATAVSWYLGTDHAVDNEDAASAAVLIVAFVKVRFVGMYFMELRHAPTPLRLIYEIWCLVVCSVVVGMFLIL
jgi:heme/copper-type cytochrome/quinol oxidase subunit 4